MIYSQYYIKLNVLQLNVVINYITHFISVKYFVIQLITFINKSMIKSIQGYSYKVNQNIGKGYSSSVHKGINDKTSEQVSIKVIQMSKLQDPINQMLLQFEVSALKALKCQRNVLHLLDVYATKNNTYIVTQLCQGDLHNLIKVRKQIPYYQSVQILAQLLQGYSSIHKKGYLHRDIKPANIFYKNGQYKIGDFGFAIPINQIHEHKAYNVGSPVYMPPEALKDNIYGTTCDTWAIGIIFFQLLKGVVPWRAISEHKLYDKIITEPIDHLTKGLPDVARTFLANVLHLDINKRFSPQELMDWPSKLMSVQICGMNVSPIRQQNALQQVKINCLNQNRPNNNSNLLCAPHKINHHRNKSQVSNNKQNRFKINFITTNKEGGRTYDLTPRQFSLNQKLDNESPIQSSNLLSYLKFLNQTIQLIKLTTQIPLLQLQKRLEKHLLQQLQKSQTIPKFPTQINPKFQILKRKYKLFYPLSSNQMLQITQLNSQYIKQTIRSCSHSFFNDKIIILIDYLVRLYQLIVFRESYNDKQYLQRLHYYGIPYQCDYYVDYNYFQKLISRVKQIKQLSIINNELNIAINQRFNNNLNNYEYRQQTNLIKIKNFNYL